MCKEYLNLKEQGINLLKSYLGKQASSKVVLDITAKYFPKPMRILKIRGWLLRTNLPCIVGMNNMKRW